jgi:aryl-alcohol dehydrogenase-like predicted oxidoreductase
MTLSELALRYILDFPAVTSVIPGAKNVKQVEQNVRPAALPPLGAELHQRLLALYRTRLAEHVHQRW